MQYFGGKQRISFELSNFINKNYLNGNNRNFYDLFCGSCNITVNIDKNRKIYANDKHKYIISMWKELQKGWIPPKNCTKEQYDYVRDNIDIKPWVSGFIGFGCSFSGKWWGGYAKSTSNRNYCLNAYNSTMKKLAKLRDVSFTCDEYFNVDIKDGSIVYCDIPYKNTTQYSNKECGLFNHDNFYKWVQENKNNFTILISEYEENVPSDFNIIWRKESKQDIRNKNGLKRKTVEVLITPIK